MVQKKSCRAGVWNKIAVPVPYNAKIADITETYTNKHFLDLAAALSETRKIVTISFSAGRIAGTGGFVVYANEGALASSYLVYDNDMRTVHLAAGTNRLQYSLSVANDDFDLYCLGYWVEV